MTAADNVRILIEAWKVMAGRFPTAKIQQSNGVATMFGHLPLPFLNISTPDRPLKSAEDLLGALQVAKARAQDCKHASLLALCEAWMPEDWEKVAADEGFHRELNLTGMAADNLLPPRRDPPLLEFRRVTNDATARDLAMVNAHAYGMPTELFECISNMYLWHSDTFGYVGYSDGRAVTTAAVLPVAGTMYVALVATMPEAHGKGCAEAVIRHAIAAGRPSMGRARLTLHASDAGRPIYQSMGFAPSMDVAAGDRIALLGRATNPHV